MENKPKVVIPICKKCLNKFSIREKSECKTCLNKFHYNCLLKDGNCVDCNFAMRNNIRNRQDIVILKSVINQRL